MASLRTSQHHRNYHASNPLLSRRRFLQGAAGALALFWSADRIFAQEETMLTFSLPPEWAPHRRCFMAWSAAHGVYTHGQIRRIHREQAAIAQAIARFEPVIMLARSEDTKVASRLCGDTVEIVAMEVFDVWTRDSLPTFVKDTRGNTHAIGWNFNVWGEKYDGYAADRTLAGRVASWLEVPFWAAGLIGEGGAIEVNGEGTLITTETCLLNPNRNPDLSKKEVEAELTRLTGATNIIWLYGSDADTVTNGHIDGLIKFITPRVVIAEVSQDPLDPEYDDLRENVRRLERAKDSEGRPFEVIHLHRPDWEVMPERGESFGASYVNSYVANGGIIMPKFDDPVQDNAARDLFAQLHPKHDIIQLRIDEIGEGGGGIHCNTQQLPL